MEGVIELFKSFEANHELDAGDFIKQILKNRINPKLIRKLEQDYKQTLS
jgi:hypothetical protein